MQVERDKRQTKPLSERVPFSPREREGPIPSWRENERWKKWKRPTFLFLRSERGNIRLLDEMVIDAWASVYSSLILSKRPPSAG